MKKLLVALAGCGCLAVSAETLTWTGAATGNDSTNFLAAANWSPERVPQGGDTLVMNTAVTLAPCEFDFGSAGITIQNSAKVVSKTTFKGLGKLVKDGTGTFQNDYVCKHTGGTLILNGEIYQNARYENNKDGTQTKYPLGTGQIEIRRSATTAPKLNLQNYCYVYSPILVSGPCTAGQQTFYENNNPNVYGLITAEDDFLAYCGWSNGTTAGAGFRGGISAHGHTVLVRTGGSYATTLAGAIDASLMTSNGYVYVQDGGGSDPDAVLTVKKGTCTLKATGFWKGKTINLTENGSILAVTSEKNLEPSAELTVASGAKINFAAATRLRVAKLTVNGVEKAAGVYTSASEGGFITGAGELYVGDVALPDPAMMTWNGSAKDNKWTTAANWTPARVPMNGDTAVFTQTVRLTNDAVGVSSELTIDVSAGNNVYGYFAIDGTGKVIKRGGGTFRASKASTYSGGTDIENGTMGVNASNALGTGPVRILAQNGYKPVLAGLSWAPAFTNDVAIIGDASSYKPITCSNSFTLYKVTSESDFTADTTYGPLSFVGSVTAPDCTMTYQGNSSFKDTSSTIEGTLDVSLRVQGVYRRTLSCTGTGIDNSLSFENGTNTLADAFAWAGTNITVSGSKTLVILNSSGHFAPNATICVSGGAKLCFGSNTTICIGKLFVNGNEVTPGVYTAEQLPDAFNAGAGTLYVGVQLAQWVGPKVGQWSDPENWSTKKVPQSGDTAYFPNTGIIISNTTGSVAFDGDLIIENPYDITWSFVLTGSGRLIKRGAGKFCIRGAKLAHEGGIRVEGGILQMDNKSALGTGKLTLVRTATVKPWFDLSQAGTELVINNPIDILGPASTERDIAYNNDPEFKGKITAEDDFGIYIGWSNRRYYGSNLAADVDAHGHLMRLTGSGLNLSGKVDASISHPGNGLWTLKFTKDFRGTDAAATLTLGATNATFVAGAQWAGNVVVNGKDAHLTLNDRSNLAKTAAVTVTGGAKIVVAKGASAKVASLTVGDAAQPEGVYRKDSAPAGSTPGSTFVGDGRFVVGDPGLILLVK